MAACDGLDGIVDKVASNYRACKAAADPAIAALRCPSGGDTGPTCLSDRQIAAVNAAHAGYTFSFARANGLTSYAGFGYGSEGVPGNWTTWMTGSVPPTFTVAPNVAGLSNLFSFGNATVRYFFARDKDFNPLTFGPNGYQARITQVSGIMDATDPDLSAFFARGGKVILREDLSDTAQSPFTGLDYFDAVTARLGATAVSASFRAYVSPGLPHTSGGIAAGAPNAPAYGIPGLVDWVPILENWSERGVAPPDQVTASLVGAVPPYAVGATKPLCRYPAYPRYVGTTPTGGNTAANYQCVTT